MSALPALPMMQLLLRQGRLPATLSLGLLLVALLLLGLVPAPAPVSQVLWLASVAGGLVQGYYAWRLQLDAGLLQLLQDQGLGGEAAARWLDEQLQATGLRPAAAAAATCGWELRWAGMRRLLLRQHLACALQLAALLLALGWPLI